MNKNLIELEAQSINKIKPKKELDFVKMEKVLNIKFPYEYKKMIKDFNGSSIGFEKGAQYIPKIAPPIVNEKGYLGLDFFYGIGDDKLNIFYENESYKGILPPNLVTIGLVLSGDEICFDRINQNIVYWWHEAPFHNEQVFLISNSFSDFLRILKPEDIEDENIENKIIMSKSYLNF